MSDPGVVLAFKKFEVLDGPKCGDCRHFVRNSLSASGDCRFPLPAWIMSKAERKGKNLMFEQWGGDCMAFERKDDVA